MRKSSTYARKRRTHTNGMEWLDALTRCRPYTDEPIPGSWLATGTQEAASNAMATVRESFIRLQDGLTPPTDEDDFNRLAHALGVASIRAWQIAGEDPATNEMLLPLNSGNAALKRVRARFLTWNKWELLAADTAAIDWAVEIYEAVVQASSPAQMSDVCNKRADWLKTKNKEMTA